MPGRSDYEERRQARIDRLQAKADSARTEASGYAQRSDKVSERFYMGQPILVGHHSEAQARRDRDKAWNLMGKSVEATERAAYYDQAAAAAENNRAISSDDPEAIAKLEEKIANLKRRQTNMKAVNKYYRKHKTCVGCEYVTEEEALELDESMKEAYSWETAPFPSYSLTSVNQRIKAAEERIRRLQSIDEMPAALIEFDGGEIESDPDTNRVIIRFDERQSDETTEALKRNGFHWSRESKAWMRLRNRNALRAACCICGVETP